MAGFLGRDFLLTTDTARKLYHNIAETLPIIDYHCHISPKEIYEDTHFDTLSDVWLSCDHYKWRLMRANGIPEEQITGNAPAEEKFRAFAKTMPNLVGSPVYQWSHLELQRGFDIYTPLTPETADKIYAEANEKLKDLSARRLMEKFHVRAICTTDDPTDDLRYHELIAADPTMKIRVLPAFRPDKAIHIEKPGFATYIRTLGQVTGRLLATASDVAEALADRIDYFAAHGCLCADHGLDACVFATPDPTVADRAFRKVMAGKPAEQAEIDAFKTFLLIACAKRYTELNWVMQIHFGCLRDINKPAVARMGSDHGHDAVNNLSGVEKLAPLLNAFTENQCLPKMILYSLNSNDNAAIASIIACFQGGTPGKLQLGSAWWMNDHRAGMRHQLEEIACNGVFGQFVGMLTDFRSFLSYTRHEYFRRVLCEPMGEWVESGQYPSDREFLHRIVANLCYNNTNQYFEFQL